MDDIRIYDMDFNLLLIENKIISSNWSVYFNSVGSFEIHLFLDAEAAETILNNLDYSKNKIPVITQGDLQGVVTGIRIADDFTVYGKTCNWFLSRKIVPKFKSTDYFEVCNPEELARKLVSDAFLKQENFVLGEKIGLSNIENFWRNTYNPLSEVVQDLLLTKNAGHNVCFDVKNKRWVFDIIPANEPQTILSEANKNAFNTEYTYNINDCFSSCWYEQEQDFVEGEFPDPIWTKLDKEEKKGIFEFECISYATVESEAKSFLDTKTKESEIISEISGLKVGEDYKLGDILRVQFCKGNILRTEIKQISGLNLGWEEGNETKQVILKSIGGNNNGVQL